MKILVCTDGSEHSQKALEEASKIASGCDVYEVAIIHVYNSTPDYAYLRGGYGRGTVTKEDLKLFRKIEEQQKEERKKILSEALKIFEKNNIKARTIFEEGHPSEVIRRVASEEGFDLIVIGSRGLGGLKKIVLGSVSSAVVNEAEVNVLTVK